MKILLTGSTGMLGSECKKVLSEEHEVVAPSKNEMDITSWDGVINNLQKISPDVVLNCAAFTDVDGSEKEDHLVRKINIEGPRNLAQCSARYDCKFFHISSNYVFDGQKTIPQPYFEDDSLNPLSAYGRSKLESEIAVRENSPNYVIVRTACLYGVNGKNFVKAIISHVIQKKTDVLRLADDQIGSPTWAYRLALQIRQILNIDGIGTYHATAEGYCSPFEYAGFITEKLGLEARLEPCKLKDLARPAKRPANSLMENRLLKKQAINVMVDWKEDMNTFLDTYGGQLIKEAEA